MNTDESSDIVGKHDRKSTPTIKTDYVAILTELNNKNRELQQSLNEQKTTIEQCQNEKDTLQKNNEQLHDKNTTLETDNQQLHAENTTLQRANDTLNNEKEACKDSLTTCTEKTTTLQQDLNACNTTKERLQAALNDAEIKLQSITRFKARFQEVQNTISELKKTGATQSKQAQRVIDEKDTEIQQLKNQIVAIRTTLDEKGDLATTNAQLQIEIQELTKKISALEASMDIKNRELTQQLQDAKKGHETDKTNLSNLYKGQLRHQSNIIQHQIQNQIDSQSKKYKQVFGPIQNKYMAKTPCETLQPFNNITQVNETIQLLANEFNRQLNDPDATLDEGLLTRICCTAIHADEFALESIQLPIATFKQEQNAMIGMDWVMGLRGLALSKDYGMLVCNLNNLTPYIKKVNANGGFKGIHPGMHMFTSYCKDADEPLVDNVLCHILDSNRYEALASQPNERYTEIMHIIETNVPDGLKLIQYDLLPAFPNFDTSQGYPCNEACFSMVVLNTLLKKSNLVVVDDIGQCVWIYTQFQLSTDQKRDLDTEVNKKISTQEYKYKFYTLGKTQTNLTFKICRRVLDAKLPLGYKIIGLK